MKPRIREIGDLAAVTVSDGARPMPLLVLRAQFLERIAWRDGRRAATCAERASARAFVEAAAKSLRREDGVAHDGGSTVFVAALLAPARDAHDVVSVPDCRSALSRLAGNMACSAGQRLRTGWTIVPPSTGVAALTQHIADALRRGKRERARYAYFSAIGHELRTPVASLRGFLDTLLAEELDEPTRRRFLEIARAESARLASLVDGLFDLSALDLGVASCRDAPAFPGAVIAAATDAVLPLALGRSMTVASECATAAHLGIGHERLVQILINILENGIKHGREGGRLFVSAEPVGTGQMEIRVDDDGPGVPADEREIIFSLGRRGASASASAGSGVGLAVVRMMVERAGGTVDVASSALGGASFRVRIPLASP